MRPGPASIPAGEAPEGVVVHVYDLAGVLVTTSHLTPDTDIDVAAECAAVQADTVVAAGEPVVMVAYDGDTGQRLTRQEWLEWLLT